MLLWHSGEDKQESNEPDYDYDQDEDEGYHQDHNIKFIERLVCDDDIDFKSQDEYSSQSMHSPPLSVSGASGLRVPVSSMLGHGPSYKATKAKW